MGSRKIVLVSTAGFSVLNTGIFWREAKTKRLFSQCGAEKSLRFISNKFMSNLKIFALLLMMRKITLVVKFDENYVHFPII
jgi:hypothetical protein